MGPILGSYSVNGLAIVFLQIPFTHALDRIQAPVLARAVLGALIYGVGYFVSLCHSATAIAVAILIVTLGEIVTPPALYTAVSHMAPHGYMGRFMGIFATQIRSDRYVST